MFKKIKVFLVVILFIFVGITTANAQEIAEWDAFISFELGLHFGVILDTDETPADPVFNWGFKSNVFDWKEKDEQSLYLSLYYTVFEGDPDTGAGKMVAWTFFSLETGMPGHYRYWPFFFIILDPFGMGQNRMGYTEIYTLISAQWHNQVQSYLRYGLVYGLAWIYLEKLAIEVYIVDYQNEGISQWPGLDDLVFKPLTPPVSWGLDEANPAFDDMNSGKTEFSIGVTDIDLAPVKIAVDTYFTLMRSVYATMDDNIGNYLAPYGYPWSVWYGSYLGVPEDERPGYDGFYTWGFNLSVNVDLKDLGFIRLWGNVEFNKLTADTPITKLTGTGNFKLDFDKLLGEKMRIAFGAYYEFIQRTEVAIQGESINATIYGLPFRHSRLELIFDWHYIIDAGIKIKPNLKAVFDLANILNGYNMPSTTPTDDTILAYIITAGVDLGLGGDGLLEFPIYIRFTNVPLITIKKWTESPWNYRLTVGEARDDNGIGEVPDHFLRILWGFGFKFNF